jgi:diaminopimelate decarboxylase
MPENLSPREGFGYRQGRFQCEGVALSSLAERFGTPTYVYSQAVIACNYRSVSEDLSRVPHLICYSVKANSSLRVLRVLKEAGAGFDVVSGGELARALRVGAGPESVVFSGVGKTQEEIDAGLNAGIFMFNVESAGELEMIDGRARALGKTARISVRVNPGVAANTHPYISTGQVIHKFGVPRHEALGLYRRAARSLQLTIRGVACHIGSQILEIEPFLEALDEILSIAERLRSDGLGIEVLDLGGGFGIRYSTEQPLDFREMARGIESRLRGTPYRLILEPGRALVGNAGILLTRVLYVKRNEHKSFIVVDAGMNDLMRPALYGSYHQVVPEIEPHGEMFRADVVGPLCETGDFLAQDREMPAVQPGDLLAVLTAGAYGSVLSSNYNSRPRPAEVMVHANQAELIRSRETVDDLMARELF